MNIALKYTEKSAIEKPEVTHYKCNPIKNITFIDINGNRYCIDGYIREIERDCFSGIIKIINYAGDKLLTITQRSIFTSLTISDYSF